jgi:D-arabinose 1-dehydrogenase-like Zn-dependent alcohol dehydrogenase
MPAEVAKHAFRQLLAEHGQDRVPRALLKGDVLDAGPRARALGQLQGLNGMPLAFGRKGLAGSIIGGIAETQQVIGYCAARNIKADIELVRADEINRAYERVVNKDVRYRFVIDMASLKA